jgi:hypothetical protein
LNSQGAYIGNVVVPTPYTGVETIVMPIPAFDPTVWEFPGASFPQAGLGNYIGFGS